MVFLILFLAALAGLVMMFVVAATGGPAVMDPFVAIAVAVPYGLGIAAAVRCASPPRWWLKLGLGSAAAVMLLPAFFGATMLGNQALGAEGRNSFSRNILIQSNVNAVRKALVEYARDHGKLPPAVAFPAALRQRNYLVGNKMPASPWPGGGGATWYQDVGVPLASSPVRLPTAAAIAGGAPRPILPLVLGPAHEAPPLDATVCGVVLYDVTADGRTAVIYGVGRRGAGWRGGALDPAHHRAAIYAFDVVTVGRQ